MGIDDITGLAEVSPGLITIILVMTAVAFTAIFLTVHHTRIF